ncbi:hypothetical protein [Clostridioides difficile]|nr:hypothetical protein [Clostridioides difficile]
MKIAKIHIVAILLVVTTSLSIKYELTNNNKNKSIKITQTL